MTLIAFPVACHELKNLEKTHKKYKAMFRMLGLSFFYDKSKRDYNTLSCLDPRVV